MKVKYVLTALISTIIIIIAIILLVSSAKRQKIRRERKLEEMKRKENIYEERRSKENVSAKMDSLKEKYNIYEYERGDSSSKFFQYSGESEDWESSPGIETEVVISCPSFRIEYDNNNKAELSELFWGISYTVNKSDLSKPSGEGYIEIYINPENIYKYYFDFLENPSHNTMVYSMKNNCMQSYLCYTDWAMVSMKLRNTEIELLKDIFKKGYEVGVTVESEYSCDSHYERIKLDSCYERIVKTYEEIEKYLSRY